MIIYWLQDQLFVIWIQWKIDWAFVGLIHSIIASNYMIIYTCTHCSSSLRLHFESPELVIIQLMCSHSLATSCLSDCTSHRYIYRMHCTIFFYYWGLDCRSIEVPLQFCSALHVLHSLSIYLRIDRVAKSTHKTFQLEFSKANNIPLKRCRKADRTSQYELKQ